MRRCIGCHESRPQSELLRFTYSDGTFRADSDSRNDGRGCYLCRNAECLDKSFRRKAWNRIARASVDTEEIRRAVMSALSN